MGVAAYAGFTVVASAALFFGVKAVMGLRVSADEEIEGLDSGEHAMHAYDFLSTVGHGASPSLSATAPLSGQPAAAPVSFLSSTFSSFALIRVSSWPVLKAALGRTGLLQGTEYTCDTSSEA
jgi:Amt family ammonium transporter